jgi:beta-glucanase (GH16 family)
MSVSHDFLNGAQNLIRTRSRRHNGRRLTALAALIASTAVVLPLSNASAEALPSGNTAFGRQILREGFGTPLNPARWGVYDGQPGGAPNALWSRKHVELHLDAARLRGYREGGRFVTAGMMLTSVPQIYGKYLVRARFDRSTTVDQVMLLWPKQGVSWPPEIDFSEGPSSTKTMATAHYTAQNLQTHHFASVDMTKWHTYGVEWTPTRVSYLIDGRVFGSVTGAAVPHVPMNLAIQTQSNAPAQAIGTAMPREVTEYIDWVSVYRYH